MKQHSTVLKHTLIEFFPAHRRRNWLLGSPRSTRKARTVLNRCSSFGWFGEWASSAKILRRLEEQKHIELADDFQKFEEKIAEHLELAE